MQDHELMNMFMHSNSSSSASFSSLHGLSSSAPCFNPFTIPESNLVGPGFFDVPQIGMGLGGGYCGDFDGMVEGAVMGLESDFSMPALESSRGNIVENGCGVDCNVDKKNMSNHSTNNNNNNNSSSEQSIKVEDVLGIGNHWQVENLRMGEWDLEGLLENVPSFPYLDFQAD